MKKISLLGSLVLIATLSYFFLSKEEGHSFKKSEILSSSSSRKLFLGARKKSPTVTTQEAGSAVQDSCTDLTNQLEAIDFNTSINEWIESIDDSNLDACKDPATLAQITNLKNNCFENFDENMCAQNAVFLRAALRTRNIEDGEDKELLADLILKEFSGKTPDFNKLANFAEKLMDLDPDQKAYQKLWASSKVIAKLGPNSSPMDVAQEISDRVGEEIFDAEDMQGLKLAMNTGFNPNLVEDYARGFLNQKETSGMHEVLGWSLWKQNRYTEAVAELSRALELNPKDKWLQEQLQKVQSRNANQNSYQARIQLGFDYQDLYN